MGSKIDIRINKDDFKRKLDIQDGKTPTQEELVSIIKPLIPEPIKGDDGDDYILTKEDKEEIASNIKVPVVEKVIEKTEVIKEQPIYNTTEVVKEVSKQITEEDITNIAVQINPIIEYSKIKDAPKWPAGGFSRITKDEVQKMIDEIPPSASTYSSLTDVNMTGLADGNVPLWDETTGKWIPGTATDTDEKVKLNASDPTAGYLDDKITGYGFLTAESDTLDTVTDRGATTTNDITVADVVKTRSGTITRDGNGYISSITKTGGRTITFTRDGDNYISSFTDSTNTWTITRTGGLISSWSVA